MSGDFLSKECGRAAHGFCGVTAQGLVRLWNRPCGGSGAGGLSGERATAVCQKQAYKQK